ncbi:MAG TPA: thioredoxin domain-containing protein [Acidimicrobiales bacterium]|jgi:thiol-disulfide isomerase/thioredoxin|nr:thioredoxin domain-containing protein [Acidimicrobiales bacterium]
MSGSVWVVSYVLLWLAVVGLTVVVIALLRQVGVLHARLQPLGVHPAGEGPHEGEPAPPLPAVDYSDAAATLVTFTSPTCTVCEQLAPSLRALEAQYGDVRLVEIAMNADTSAVFSAFAVRSTPYLVAVDREGIVRGKGVANSLEQAEVLVEEALADA